MENMINQALLNHIAKQDMIDSILKKIDANTSSLIEIIGSSGTGKTYLFKRLSDQLAKRDIDSAAYNPTLFEVNHLLGILEVVSDIGEEEFKNLLEIARKMDTESKYDFFYFLTERLKELGLLTDRVVLIDNCSLLDSYTRDFVQYFIQYAVDFKVKIIAFSTEPLFPFSDKIELNYLNKAEIFTLLKGIFADEEVSLEAQSEILFNISSGNTYVIESILKNFGPEVRKHSFSLDRYIDKQISVTSIYNNKIEALDKKQQKVLSVIFLLDGMASSSVLEDYFSRKTGDITPEMINPILIQLKRDALIEEINDNYIIKKIECFKDYFFAQQEDKRFDLYKKVTSYMKKHIGISQLSYGSYLAKLHLMDSYKPIGSLSFFKDVNRFLETVKDYEVLQEINKFRLAAFEDNNDKIELLEYIGSINKKLNRFEEASDNYREALRIGLEKKVTIDLIVYGLAESLYRMGSSAFAFEVVKKYESSIQDIYIQCKLLLLKAEIQIELNNDEEAKKYTENAYEKYVSIEDEIQRQQIYAEVKKVYGKIYYYTNQWEKAETSFTEAGKVYGVLKNVSGQAAIYNNIGILKMCQGDWEGAENLYLKSLTLEEQRYSLEGVSVCYNNLGGLWEDRGDYKKSLNYFNEALRIQKLLSDRYNICNIYNNIGVTYMDNGEFGKAAEAFEKTLEVARNFNLLKNLIAALNNLGALHFKTGNWSHAIECYEEAIDKSKKNKFLDGLCKSYNNLGELHEKRGDYELAYDLYFKATKIIPELNDEYQKAEISGNMGSVLTNLHKFSEAYGYLVESLDFFKALNAQDKIIECSQKMAYYFIMTRNYESASYYLDQASIKAEDISNVFEIGKTYYLKGLLEKKDTKTAQQYFEKAIKIFVETKNLYELALANYEYASILYDNSDWQQALEILTNNKKILNEYGAISLIEKNDLFMQRIEKDCSVEIRETKSQETLLNKFYETTQNLKSISSFDTLLEYTLDSFVDLSEADGGILSLYNTHSNPDSWEYKLFNNFSDEDKDYDTMMNIVHKTYLENEYSNFKQPYFAAQYNNIVSFPLSFHNQTLGVILLFSKHGSHYFTEKVCNLLNALCNQTVVIIENFRHNALSRSHAIIREELSTPQLFTNIIGKSEKMMDIFNIIEKVKDTPTTILLEGQSGTGKELIARAIHYSSSRRNKKFIAQYCGSLPETLLESELFGHVKGSFTGATYDKKGLFEVADGGSFFLDEIADISLSTQAKLLRFLQEGEIKRVGSTKTTQVDVRVICATNVPLKDKIEKGEFRLDLYYRLNVIRIEMPRLSERKSDIPLLAIHFLDKYNKKIGKNVKGIADETMKYFQNCEWPGNIRQLENEIERAVTLVENGSIIKPSDLSEDVFRYTRSSQSMNFLNKVVLKEAVEELEQEMIMKSLEKNSWNQTKTAAELGLSRQGLIKKIKRYDLEK